MPTILLPILAIFALVYMIFGTFAAILKPCYTMRRKRMANFCRQCMLQIWGEDESDFEIVGVASPYAGVQQKNIVLCEGCGYILVNGAGSCIDPNCKLHGHPMKMDGINLSEKEKSFIKNALANGHADEAQKFILDKLDKEFRRSNE